MEKNPCKAWQNSWTICRLLSHACPRSFLIKSTNWWTYVYWNIFAKYYVQVCILVFILRDNCMVMGSKHFMCNNRDSTVLKETLSFFLTILRSYRIKKESLMYFGNRTQSRLQLWSSWPPHFPWRVLIHLNQCDACLKIVEEEMIMHFSYYDNVFHTIHVFYENER